MARSGVWKGAISFGLLNIPVVLKTAQQEKELHFHMLDKKDHAPIKFKRVNGRTGHEVPSNRIVKAFEYEKSRYVVMSDQDFKAANVKATQTIDIEDFVDLGDIDPMMFDRPYYLVPQEKSGKGYFLLREALLKKKKAAIAKIVLHTKQHLVAVFPRGDYLILEVLRFAHEVLSAGEVDYLDDIKKPKTSARELKMAEQLIQEMSSEWKPERYKDTYYDDLMRRIQDRVKTGEGEEIEEPKVARESSKATAPKDLLPLLRQSLASKNSKKTPTHREHRRIH